MEEVPPPPPPAEPPPVLRTSEETDAMTLAAVHPYGHEEPLQISGTEFELLVRDGFYWQTDVTDAESLGLSLLVVALVGQWSSSSITGNSGAQQSWCSLNP